MKTTWLINHQPVNVQFNKQANNWQITVENHTITLQLASMGEHLMVVTIQDKPHPVHLVVDKETVWVFIHGKPIMVQKQEEETGAPIASAASAAESAIEAPMPGKILKMLVQEGEKVQAQQRLFILEAMKMENEVVAPQEGIVKKIYFQENDLVSLGQVIIELDYTT